VYFNVLNPGPTQPPPYQQPNSGNPAPQVGVADYPTGKNDLSYPLPPYVEASGSETGAPFPKGVLHILSSTW
jgi:hypothetical protein